MINGISFLAVIIALLAMKLEPQPRRQQTKSILHDLKEGLNYTWNHSVIRTIIALAGVASLFGLAFVTLFPDWAVAVLHGDASTNGLLQSARGFGALLGALMIASLGRFNFKGRLLTIGTFAFPIAILLFSFTRTLPLSLLALLGVGWAFMIVFNMANTLIQTQVSDELRGRVLGVYSLTFFGFMPLGALWTGLAAQHFGAPGTIVLGAGIALFFAILLYFSAPRLRALE
jgi:predicted MFS family arabinose efflux permease